MISRGSVLSFLLLFPLVMGNVRAAGAVMPGTPVTGSLEIRRTASSDPGLRPVAARLEARSKVGRGVRLFAGAPERSALDQIGRVIVADDRAFFGVEPADLSLRDVRSFSDEMTYVDYVQTHQGLEVVDSHVGQIYKAGKLVLSDALTFDDIAISTVPAIDASAAESIAVASLGVRAPNAHVEAAAEPVVYPLDTPAGIVHRLAYRMIVSTTAPRGRFLTIVSADGTNQILYRHDLVAYDAAQVLVEIEPRYINQAVVTVPARGHRITAALATDADGIFESTPGAVTLSSTGPFFTLNNQAATERSKPITIVGGSFEQFTWTAAEGALEELDAYYHSHTVRERQLGVTPDLAWLTTNLPVNVNVTGTCNAYYDGGSINFFPSGGGCNSTARIADVIYHEYGHGIHDHLVTGTMNDVIQEGVADYFAHTLTEDPNMGPYFFPGEIGGIRNATQVRTYPTGVQGANAEVHESGKIWTNTWWNLRTTLKAKYGARMGVKAADILHSKTLRANPGYTDAYTKTLAADDDDGNLTNGTPNSCEITAEFTAHGLVTAAQPIRGYLALTHEIPAPAGFFQAEDAPLAVSVGVESKSPANCGGLLAGSVTLHYTVDGGAPLTVALSGTTTFSGEIPGQKDGTVVEYWFSAKEDAQQAEFTAPLSAPANVYRYYVGPLTTVVKDDFETDNGWTHGSDLASHDDWERGTPTGLGFDPEGAFSGTNVFGNDIGVRGGNGLYEPGRSNWLESPAINCSACEGTRLQFRRWLSVEGSAQDKARILVNGTEVWSNETVTRNDLQWSFEDIDIATIADGVAELKIRFELESSAQINLSGWAIDDVSVMALSGGTPPGGEPPPPGGSLGNALNGGCTCTVAGQNRAPATGALATMLFALAAIVITRRRK